MSKLLSKPSLLSSIPESPINTPLFSTISGTPSLSESVSKLLTIPSPSVSISKQVSCIVPLNTEFSVRLLK